MPIPCATASDVFLRILLQKQVEVEFDSWIDAAKIIAAMPEVDRHGDNRPVPGGMFRQIEYLANHALLEFDMNSKPDWDIQTARVRLTPLGVYTALLYDYVPEKDGPVV